MSGSFSRSVLDCFLCLRLHVQRIDELAVFLLASRMGFPLAFLTVYFLTLPLHLALLVGMLVQLMSLSLVALFQDRLTLPSLEVSLVHLLLVGTTPPFLLSTLPRFLLSEI